MYHGGSGDGDVSAGSDGSVGVDGTVCDDSSDVGNGSSGMSKLPILNFRSPLVLVTLLRDTLYSCQWEG